MKAERERRAQILYAEGTKQSAILTAEGEKQSQILRAEGSAQARILEAQGQARAIQQVFDAIHRGKPTQKLLAYQYLQVLPQIARGDSNKMWIIPSELTDALKGIGGMLGPRRGRRPVRRRTTTTSWVDPGQLAGRLRRDPARGPDAGPRRGSRAWPARPARRPPSTRLRSSGSSPRCRRRPTRCPSSSRRRRRRRPAAGADPARGAARAASLRRLTCTAPPRYAARAPERAAYLRLGARGRRTSLG